MSTAAEEGVLCLAEGDLHAKNSSRAERDIEDMPSRAPGSGTAVASYWAPDDVQPSLGLLCSGSFVTCFKVKPGLMLQRERE